MNPPLDLLKVVALTEDLPEAGLLAGQVGTVGEKLADGVFEVGCRKMGGKRGRDLEFRIWSQFPPATSALRMAGLDRCMPRHGSYTNVPSIASWRVEIG
jgi:Domain of unknown function (DUF4926)